MDTIKDRIDASCKRSGTTISKVAKIAGVAPQSIYRALQRESITFPHWDDIAKILDVPVDWIRNGGPAPWESSRVSDLTTHYVSTEDIETHPLVIQLKTKCISMCERYLDLIELCKDNKLPVSTRAADEAKAFLDLLYGNKQE